MEFNLTSQYNAAKDCEEQAYLLIKQGLFDGIYPPGSRLVERQVAEKFSLSRTPIRAALRQLEHEGFLERQEGRGYSVRILGIRDAIELLDVREAIEGMAARLAAQNGTEGQRKRLMGVIERMEQDENDGTCFNYYKLCGELHQMIFEMGGNRVLADMAVRINAQSAAFHYKTLLLSERVRSSISEHKEIAEAIVNGDADAAEFKLREHVRMVKRLVSRFVEQAPLGVF